MAILLRIKNPPLPNQEETFLSSSYSSGTSLSVRNTDGWVSNDVAVAGQPGDEKTEARVINTIPSATGLTVTAAYSFSHEVDTPLFKTRYDKISLERQANGSGAYAEVLEGKITIGWDEKDGFTKILNQAGSTADNFKWRFYNSVSGEYSLYSGILPGTGLTSAHAGKMVQVVRRTAKIPANLGIQDTDILGLLNEAQKELDAEYELWWFTRTEDSVGITAIAGIYKYDLPSTFRAMDVVKVLDNNSIKYDLKFSPLVEFDQFKSDTNTSTRNDSTRNWTLLPPDDSSTIGYFGIDPTPATTNNTYYRRYYRFIPELTTFADVTIVPIPRVLIAYAVWQIYLIREDAANAAIWEDRYKDGVKKLKAMQRRQVGQADFARFRGQRGYARLFGNYGYMNRDTIHENYW